VASGNFVGATPVSSGTEYTLEIDNAQPFQYITLQWANNSQGFVLSSLELTRNPSNYAESFGYTVVDADGDSATGTFNVTPAASSSGSAVTTGTAGSDALAGSDAANTIDGLAGDDVLRGFGGADTVDGGEGVDALDGGSGDDALVGGAGNDLLRGGAGSDSLTGGAGADTFEWRLADRGSAGSPAIDTVADFDSATLDAGGDILDLRDLLQGEATSATLDRYLDFSVSGGNTTIRISSTGGFTDGTYASGSEDQRIVLSGVDIRATLGLSGAATDAQIISELINRGKLLTDVPAGG
jgi:Ca2+-binding RTX toxin-like protein